MIFFTHPLVKGKVAFLNELLHDVSQFLEDLYIAKRNLYRNTCKMEL